MRSKCTIPYGDYGSNLATVLNGGGVTWGHWRVYGDFDHAPVSGESGTVTITLYRESGRGDVDATTEQQEFFLNLNWVVAD